ncbi:hypothetical protein ACN8ZM_40185 (plasmid) [Burkholderia aenigmatica]|uniref:hypothetical protein n=1 Tax=Burkholderia aenigmatica TaxID=2015348 RepID=UPI003B42CC96
MAASEVAVAASEVAKVVAQAPAVNWWGVVASSAVIGALVNGAFKWWGDRTARSDEKAKLAEQRAPAHLEVALMLEAFARQAVDYLDEWDTRFDDWLVEQHEGPRAKPRPWPSLTLDFSLVTDWTAVRVEIQSPCRDLPVALAASSKWVGAAYDEWADFAELDWLDSQRATLYGLQASELAMQIRAEIAAPASNQTESIVRLRSEFDEVKRHYVDKHGKVNLIPDMKARLQRECPQVAMAPDPVLAPAGG